MQKPPTIRDIARAAGVGVSTVSLALRNDHRLRPATRERIQKIAEELGYRPNATLATLMAQLRGSKPASYQATLAFLNASEDANMLREIPTFREWARGAAERADELGYGMDFFWLHDPAVTPARLKEILVARGVRGLVIAAMQNNGILPAGHAALWTEFSSVAIGLRPRNPPLHFSANDQFSTARRAVEELQQLGYQRIGLVIDAAIDFWLERRFSAGFFAEIKPGGDHRLPVFAFRKNGIDAFHDWFREHKPDAIVTLHEEIKEWLATLRLTTPDDVGLVHLDRDAREMSHWAGMDQNSYCVGVTATDMIVGQLHRNDCGIPAFPKAVLIQSTWVSGGTVRQQKTKSPARGGAFAKTKQ